MTAAAHMRPGRMRRLTSGERALAQETFGRGIIPERVRLFALPVWNRAFVASGRLIVWPAASARRDFAAPDVPLGEQAVFVHELTHVWQAQNGVNLLLAKLRAGDRASTYAYDLGCGPAFEELNIEQQAMVVQHAFLLRRGGRAPFAPEAYAAVLPDWGRA